MKPERAAQSEKARRSGFHETHREDQAQGPGQFGAGDRPDDLSPDLPRRRARKPRAVFEKRVDPSKRDGGDQRHERHAIANAGQDQYQPIGVPSQRRGRHDSREKLDKTEGGVHRRDRQAGRHQEEHESVGRESLLNHDPANPDPTDGRQRSRERGDDHAIPGASPNERVKKCDRDRKERDAESSFRAAVEKARGQEEEDRPEEERSDEPCRKSFEAPKHADSVSRSADSVETPSFGNHEIIACLPTNTTTCSGGTESVMLCPSRSDCDWL